MDSTGIIRKVDDLGRIVIPKEIRSLLRIKYEDPLEIFVNRDEIILKKCDMSLGVKELIGRLNYEFSNVKSDIETANKIFEHIHAISNILKNMKVNHDIE